MLPLPRFLQPRPELAAFALLATATSGFGQTFLMSVFGGEIRAAFDLSHSAYGTLYGAATLVSALLLLRAGAWVDHWPLRRAVAVTLLLLALGCLTVGLAPTAALLLPGFLLIRFAGQGLSAHLGLTAAGRYFSTHRGKVMALAASGFPLAEALLPAAAVAIMGLGGWRMPWLLGAGFLLLCMLPLLLRLTWHAPSAAEAAREAGGTDNGHRRRDALRDPGFYLLLPAVLAAPFIVTAMLFHQAAIAEAREWPLPLMGAAFTGFAAGHLASLLLAGPLVDRIGAHRALPLALGPIGLGLLILAFGGGGGWVPFAYLTLTGATLGWGATAGGAIWAERYGVRHLGAIRAMAHGVMVASTAIAPVVAGVLLDRGWSVTALAGAMVGYVLVAGLCARAAPAPPAMRAPAGG
ncbi:MFS transporter [Alkalilimnicola ehrlichii MLHE-1]|uniref:Major facilitator superfamily MFS_1 n=1 Tax=Alkalilimnicola ehrlichii (strain ATCC BAA-1101 / DSM 17681 / MLHE-1) TaxID=187272 RepID=Q0A6L2_ALKEH|nr:major facilitator superfamily MFS_1 [Alkalilimnicola ehrlichii MLHE-1]